MSSHKNQLAVKGTEAAKLLSLTTAAFLELVEKSALPQPVLLGGKHPRWSVADLDAVLSGEKTQSEGFET